MGKRKSRKVEQKKAVEKVATVFNCPWCNHENSVECTINRGEKIGYLQCRICSEDYRTTITNLDAPIDVFSQWIDEAEKINER